MVPATEKNPEKSITLPGLLQVVASACRLLLIRAAGVSGDGNAARVGPLSLDTYNPVLRF